jgi:hypothetical protein
MTTTKLMDEEVTSKVALVTEAEVDAFYQANRAQRQNQGSEEQCVHSYEACFRTRRPKCAVKPLSIF